MIEKWEIAGGVLEYFDDTHTYIFDGIILPSITQILKKEFGNKYNNVSEAVLKRASEKGTQVHQAIENYEKHKIDDTTCQELRNYKFLKKQLNFECIDNEVPIVLFLNGTPVSAGRIDLILKEGNEIGIGDIKRTSEFDKNYVAFQTNLYRIGYQQTYGVKISFLRGLHLRQKKRKYHELRIDEESTLNLVKKYLEDTNEW